MKQIHVDFQKYKEMRYPTLGDYAEFNNCIRFFIATTDDKGKKIKEKEQFLTLIHEMVEAYLCFFQGVEWKEIDKYDIDMDKKNPDIEPGDQEDAPYHKQHEIAKQIEKFLASELGVNWEEYNG